MSKRIGFYSLRKVARELCKHVYTFTPIIAASGYSNPALLAALAAANAACAVLVEAIDEVAPEGV